MVADAWETEFYARGQQLNRWPFSDLVSDVMRLSAASDRSQMSALDLGCGAGNNAWFLLDAGFRVAGIDISPTAVRIAGNRLAELGFADVDLRVGSFAQLPWDDGSFDLVVDRGSLGQATLDDVAATLSEVRRVLKPGGLLLSYNLFGWNDSDRKFGIELAPRSFGRFSGGRFWRSPMTTFFDDDLIREMWAPLVVKRVVRHQVSFGEEDDHEEHYTVHAMREN